MKIPKGVYKLANGFTIRLTTAEPVTRGKKMGQGKDGKIYQLHWSDKTVAPFVLKVLQSTTKTAAEVAAWRKLKGKKVMVWTIPVSSRCVIQERMEDTLRNSDLTNNDARKIRALFKKLHQAGVHHGNAHSSNIMSTRTKTGGKEFRFIDMSRSTLFPEKITEKNINKLYREAPKDCVKHSDTTSSTPCILHDLEQLNRFNRKYF